LAYVEVQGRKQTRRRRPEGCAARHKAKAFRLAWAGDLIDLEVKTAFDLFGWSFPMGPSPAFLIGRANAIGVESICDTVSG
jgi:hypothetical protein